MARATGQLGRQSPSEMTGDDEGALCPTERETEGERGYRERKKERERERGVERGRKGQIGRE